MAYVYIDESGDLGFTERGSDYFVIACVKVDDDETNKNLQRIPKKIRQRKLRKKYHKCPELKFSNSSSLIREQFLSRAARLNIEVYSVIIKKEYTQEKLRNNLPILYNYILKILLEKPLSRIGKNNSLTVFLDKCMSKTQVENFENYVKTEFLSIFQEIPNVEIIHESSQNNGGIQVADFICGAFGYKYNTAKLKNDYNRYTDIVQPRTVIEKTDLFKKK
jgi:Protein of unknown function (DUF3800)